MELNTLIPIGKYVISLAEKVIFMIDKDKTDCYIFNDLGYPTFNNVEVAEIGDVKHIELIAEDDQKLVLDIKVIDGKNRVINLDDPFVTEIKGPYFDDLIYAESFKAVNLKSVEVDDFLSDTKHLKTVDLRSLVECGDKLLAYSGVEEVNLSSLENSDVYLLYETPNLKKVIRKGDQLDSLEK